MQCNVECRLPEEPPPMSPPPQRGHAYIAYSSEGHAYIAYSSTNSLKRLTMQQQHTGWVKRD